MQYCDNKQRELGSYLGYLTSTGNWKLIFCNSGCLAGHQQATGNSLSAIQVASWGINRQPKTHFLLFRLPHGVTTGNRKHSFCNSGCLAGHQQATENSLSAIQVASGVLRRHTPPNLTGKKPPFSLFCLTISYIAYEKGISLNAAVEEAIVAYTTNK